jgi:hypothetical protein
LRVDGQRLFTGADGFLVLALRAQAAQVVPQLWVVRSQGEGVVIGLGRRCELLAGEQHIAQVIAPVGIGRSQLGRLVHQGQTFIMLAALVQQYTQVMRRCMVLVELQQQTIVVFRVVQAAGGVMGECRSEALFEQVLQCV